MTTEIVQNWLRIQDLGCISSVFWLVLNDSALLEHRSAVPEQEIPDSKRATVSVDDATTHHDFSTVNDCRAVKTVLKSSSTGPGSRG